MRMSGPLANRLAASLRRRFACAGLQPGDRLPSLRSIERASNVSRSVVMAAMDQLEREGVLRCAHGQGTFLVSVPSLASAGVQQVLVLAVGLTADHPYLTRLLAGLSDAATALGCTMAVLPIGMRGIGLRVVLEQRGPAGLLVVGEPTRPVLAAVRTSGLPCVVAGGDAQAAGRTLSWVGHDDREGGYQATQHLLALGHRRIAWIGSSKSYHRMRWLGYRDALTDARLAVPACLHPDLRRVLRAAPPPDALLIAGDELAPAIYRALARRRCRVGADCAVVGFDDLALAAGLDPPLTTMRAEVERLGGEALRLLLRRIAGHPPEQVLLPRRLVRRASSAMG